MPSKEFEKVMELRNARPMQPDLSVQERRAQMEAMPGFPVVFTYIVPPGVATTVPAPLSTMITLYFSAKSRAQLTLSFCIS